MVTSYAAWGQSDRVTSKTAYEILAVERGKSTELLNYYGQSEYPGRWLLVRELRQAISARNIRSAEKGSPRDADGMNYEQNNRVTWDIATVRLIYVKSVAINPVL